MTPKEKAKELVEKFISLEITVLGCGKNEGNPCIVSDNMYQMNAKQCAIIAVDEVLSISYFYPDHMSENDSFYKNYWILVKTEIEQL